MATNMMLASGPKYCMDETFSLERLARSKEYFFGFKVKLAACKATLHSRQQCEMLVLAKVCPSNGNKEAMSGCILGVHWLLLCTEA